MLTATCHCGAVRIDVPNPPLKVSDCNCSICRRYGTRWAYYQSAQVTVHAEPGATRGYSWGRKVLRFVACGTCGCVTHWERIVPVEGSKMGVNARNFEPSVLEGVPVEMLDGAAD
ncbi:MAG: GFA family protein [Betaproteobacteria bacterium]